MQGNSFEQEQELEKTKPISEPERTRKTKQTQDVNNKGISDVNDIDAGATFESSGHSAKHLKYPEEPRFNEDFPYTGTIQKVNGVEAYSQAQALYKGVGRLQNFEPDPKVNPETGKVPAGSKNHYPYPTYTGPRDNFGFEPYGPIGGADQFPIIAPEATGRGETTVHSKALHTTWRDLRRELNRGMGARTNKYVLELEIPVIKKDPDPYKLNVLCQAVSIPGKSLAVADVWRMGRKYRMRGETQFGDTWTVTFLDDSEHNLRQSFNWWLDDIDYSAIQHTALDIYDNLKDPRRRLMTAPLDMIERELGGPFNFKRLLGNLLQWNSLREEYASSAANYQTDIKVYQLDQTGNKVNGYVMQNAFISEITPIQYADADLNNLVQFDVTFAFSEWLPLSKEGYAGNTFDKDHRVFVRN